MGSLSFSAIVPVQHKAAVNTLARDLDELCVYV